MARARRLPARGIARRRVPPLAPGLDLRRQPGNGARRKVGAAAGPRIRPDLSAQPRRASWPGQRMSEPIEQQRLLEALLFAAPEPLSEEELTPRLGEETDVSGLLRELSEAYAGRGVNLVQLAGGWTFRTAPDLAPNLRSERAVSRKLSRAAVETLAIVAYHQPVTRAEIEAIRGVALARGTLDRLLEAGWVRPKGRRDSPGRPLTWAATPAFLAHFGLDSLNELPGVDELRAAGLLDIGPAVLGEAAEIVEQEAEAEEQRTRRSEASKELHPWSFRGAAQRRARN